MDRLDQTSTPQFKRCNKCGEIKPIDKFERGRGVCYSCRYQENRLERMKSTMRYQATDRGREKHRIAQRVYSQTDKGHWKKLLNASLHRQKHNESNKKWRINHPDYEKKRCHWIQDKYGCHRKVINWYPAARLLEALETAEVVEVKV